MRWGWQWTRLVEEARGTRKLVSEDEILNDLRNTGKPVIVVRGGGDTDAANPE